MPRDGSNIYHKPFPDVAPNTTVASAVYNGFVADVEQDLNLPRPIVAGGTGSSSAAQSLFNLGAEMSSQVVTNYDSHVWVPGSFHSAADITMTSAPVPGHAFVGTVVSSDVPAYPPSNQNVVVSARDQNDTVVPGVTWVREKKAGVWGPWTSTQVLPTDLTGREVASQAVTNFDTQLLLPGSFYSTGAAVNPPVAAHTFVGWVVSSDVPAVPPINQNVVVYAYDQNDTVVPATLWVRQKKAGVWGAWVRAAVSMVPGRNKLINGSCQINQRSISGVTASGYFIDRWQLIVSALGNVTASQAAGAAGNVPAYYGITITTGTGVALPAGNIGLVSQVIEGVNTNDLAWGTVNASPVTLSFWANANQPGTRGIAIRNFDGSRSYIGSYTINSPGVWEYKTIVIPGDTAGTWKVDTSAGIRVEFDIGTGATYSAAAGNWYGGASSPFGLTGGYKQAAVTGAVLYITAIQLERGTVATPFENVQYGTDLELCMRYYSLYTSFVIVEWHGDGNAYTNSRLIDPPMRATPTVTLGGISGSNVLGGYPTGAAGSNTAFGLTTAWASVGIGNVSMNIVLNAEL